MERIRKTDIPGYDFYGELLYGSGSGRCTSLVVLEDDSLSEVAQEARDFSAGSF